MPTNEIKPTIGDVLAPAAVVGRARELELLRAAVTAGRDVLLEGPPGTSKTTMLRAITEEWGVPLMFVEGNADLTTGKLVGHHAPDRVLREGYRAENFVDGPLVEAMRQGGFLYIEELNRSPQDTLNTLLGAMGDRRLTIPRLGTIVAEPTFRLIASMNPFDNVGTMRISMSIYDRLCRLAVGYQDEDLEREIVEHRVGPGGPGRDDRLVRDAVAVVRATRVHPDIRHGSSVRGAIDTVLVARELGRSRGVTLDWPGSLRHPRPDYTNLVLDAMTVTLSGRIQLDPTSALTPRTGALRHMGDPLPLPGGRTRRRERGRGRLPDTAAGAGTGRRTFSAQTQAARGTAHPVHALIRRGRRGHFRAPPGRPPPPTRHRVEKTRRWPGRAPKRERCNPCPRPRRTSRSSAGPTRSPPAWPW